MVKRWCCLDKTLTPAGRGLVTFGIVPAWLSPRSSCHLISVQQQTHAFHTAALTLWWSSPWKSMDHLIRRLVSPQRSRCSMLFWKGVPKCSKKFREDHCNKIVPTKVVMKRLLQLQLSKSCMDLNLNLPFFESKKSHFTTLCQLSDPGCRVQSRIGNSTGIISGTTSPQGKGFVIAHRHWCSRWLLNFYPKDHQPCEEVKKLDVNPPHRPHSCLE